MGCLAFYYASDKLSTYPKKLSVSVQAYFKDTPIGSAEELDFYIWKEATVLLPVFGYHVPPSVTPIHVDHPKLTQRSQSDFELLACQSRIMVLEKEVLRVEQERNSAMAINRTLKEQNEELLRTLMTERRIEVNRRTVGEALLRQLNKLLHNPLVLAGEEDE